MKRGQAAADTDDAEGGGGSAGVTLPGANRYDHLLVAALQQEMTSRGLGINDSDGKKLLKQGLRDALLADDAAKEAE